MAAGPNCCCRNAGSKKGVVKLDGFTGDIIWAHSFTVRTDPSEDPASVNSCFDSVRNLVYDGETGNQIWMTVMNSYSMCKLQAIYKTGTRKRILTDRIFSVENFPLALSGSGNIACIDSAIDHSGGVAPQISVYDQYGQNLTRSPSIAASVNRVNRSAPVVSGCKLFSVGTNFVTEFYNNNNFARCFDSSGAIVWSGITYLGSGTYLGLSVPGFVGVIVGQDGTDLIGHLGGIVDGTTGNVTGTITGGSFPNSTVFCDDAGPGCITITDRVALPTWIDFMNLSTRTSFRVNSYPPFRQKIRCFRDGSVGYVLANISSGLYGSTYLEQWNSSGTLNWTTTIPTSVCNVQVRGITVDDDSNVYIC
jgi:hypothetical protein